MRAADVLLAPADGEPFGLAVAEALATGTPAVVPDRGGPGEFVRMASTASSCARIDSADWTAGGLSALQFVTTAR